MPRRRAEPASSCSQTSTPVPSRPRRSPTRRSQRTESATKTSGSTRPEPRRCRGCRATSPTAPSRRRSRSTKAQFKQPGCRVRPAPWLWDRLGSPVAGFEGSSRYGCAEMVTISDRLLANVERVVLGKHEEIALVLAGLAADGHVLLEDVPGTAKTILARSIAQTIEGASFARIQCTPDLQPTDVTGLSIYDQKTREFEFRPGPIFANIVLVDEINRAMPKTQSALLEAMAEHQVTVDGVTRPLLPPFMVLATENPVEYEGTFPLPEAQLDRFFVRTALGYPSLEDEFQIVLDQQADHHPLADLGPVVTTAEVSQLQDAVRAVYVDELLRRWIVELVRSTREVEMCAVGASVRGTLALERAARAWALLDGREFVVSDDVELLFLPVIAHRVGFRPAFRAQARRTGWDDALADFRDACLRLVPAPEVRRGQPA